MKSESETRKDNMMTMCSNEKNTRTGESTKSNEETNDFAEKLQEIYQKGHDDGVKYGKEDLLDYLTCRIDNQLSNNITTDSAMAFCVVLGIIKQLRKELEEEE